MMARIPARGSMVVSPQRDEASFTSVLSELGLGSVTDEEERHGLYMGLAGVVGRWWREAGRLDSSILIKSLGSVANDLRAVAKLVAATEGFHTSHDLECALLVRIHLERQEDIQSREKALELMDDFRVKAAKVADACESAVAELGALTGRPGRPQLEWYDEFTALLLDLAEKGNVNPTLRKDRITGERSGWLLRAALALETFLYPDMRSHSIEACGKRLERAKRNLERRIRQNRSAS
jgi:hypothetical protein